MEQRVCSAKQASCSTLRLHTQTYATGDEPEGADRQTEPLTHTTAIRDCPPSPPRALFPFSVLARISETSQANSKTNLSIPSQFLTNEPLGFPQLGSLLSGLVHASSFQLPASSPHRPIQQQTFGSVRLIVLLSAASSLPFRPAI